MRKQLRALLRKTYDHLTPWQTVQVSRHPKRPLSTDYIAALDSFDELHGDRHFRDDHALVGGFAKIRGRRVVVLAQRKGRDTKENIYRNFGMVSPEGYRKAKRLMELASRFRLPIVSFVDTSGADPGIASEEHAQSEAIASCLVALAKATVPVVATIIGEGGSGGAIALAAGDKILMLENAVYSVISPEGCASILWRDAASAPQAAEAMRITAADMKDLKLIDEIIPEPIGGAHRYPEKAIRATGDAIAAALPALMRLDPAVLRSRRREKFLAMGREG